MARFSGIGVTTFNFIQIRDTIVVVPSEDYHALDGNGHPRCETDGNDCLRDGMGWSQFYWITTVRYGTEFRTDFTANFTTARYNETTNP